MTEPKGKIVKPLEGKSAIVTGAARGIGKAIALALATEGMDVLVCARSVKNDPALPGTIGETADAIQALGGRGVAHQTDLSRDEDVRAMIDRAYQEFGRIDLIVNNAAYLASGTMLGSPISEFEMAFAVNLRAPYLSAQLAAPIMKAQGGGAIFNITAPGNRPIPSDMRPVPFRTPVNPCYSVSKAALESFTRMLAFEGAEYGVASAAIDPLFTDTEMARFLTPDDFDTSFGNDPDMIGRVVAFMAMNPEAFNGQIVVARDVAEAHGLG